MSDKDKVDAIVSVAKTVWPARFKVVRTRVEKTKMVITEIKRPEPQAVLVLEEGKEVTLTRDEYLLLFHRDAGPIFPSEWLKHVGPAGKEAPAAPAPKGAAPAPAPKADPAAASSDAK